MVEAAGVEPKKMGFFNFLIGGQLRSKCLRRCRFQPVRQSSGVLPRPQKFARNLET
jgi:hypothetical protein